MWIRAKRYIVRVQLSYILMYIDALELELSMSKTSLPYLSPFFFKKLKKNHKFKLFKILNEEIEKIQKKHFFLS